jgi:hypothetical protein
MALYSDPPTLRTFRHDKPTLLVCWWATALCTCIIVLRIVGRFIRTERLFPEDRIAALALIPLFLRMGCVHYILLHGTNNAQLEGVVLTDLEIRHKEIASGLVLLSRVLYAATLWILKSTILEFFRRLTDVSWERSYQRALVAVRWTLLLTFVAVVISDLAECQPFYQYWQVLPVPDGQCRQGYAQLITMAACNILTDLLLVFFPVPIILQSHVGLKRKIQLTCLFSLSLTVVAVTLYRVPHIIWEDGRQQYRSLLASIELIFATTAANALVLGSFVRDRGVKKAKFRRASAADSFDRGSNARRPTLQRQWGSDEDLVRDMGIAVDPELQDKSAVKGPSPAPVAKLDNDIARWQFPQRRRSNAERSDDSLLSRDQPPKPELMATPRRVSFFDVGGLLDDSVGTSSGSLRRESHASSSETAHPQPTPIVSASSGGFRRGSSALLQDIGGLLGPNRSGSSRAKSSHKQGTELQTIFQSSQEPSPSPSHIPEPSLQDAGGLLK